MRGFCGAGWTDSAGRSRTIDRSLSVAPTKYADLQYLELDPTLQKVYGTNGTNYDNEEEYLKKYYATVTPQRMWQGKWTWPVFGDIVTDYAQPRTYNGEKRVRYHGGLDIATLNGTPVLAPAAGARPVYRQADHSW